MRFSPSPICRRLLIVGLAFCAGGDVAWRPVAAQAKQQPARPAAKGRSLKDRYPLPYPPQLPDGKSHVTERSPDFLKPGPNLREGVEIAKAPPTVDFLYYPEQNYPGNPWSHRSDGIVVGDRYYSSSNDHLAPRGTALLWEYDALKKQFRLLCDTTKFLESVNAFPPDMNYRPGEMQSRIDLGSDGWLYYATDRGSPTVTNDAHGYRGEWILRTHPATLATEIVYTHPIEKHTIPASVLDPQRMILYCGTAVGKDAPNQKIQFFALDVKNRKLLKVADDGPTRTLAFSKSTGRVYWEGKMYDPHTNEITPSSVPHVRSATAETPQGMIYGTSERSADLWALNVRTGEVRQLGSGAVASQEYIASIEADPTGRYLYYVPGAHGGASKDGTPVVQYDLQTGRHKVLAFLHDLFWEKYGYALDGSFGSALDEKGERLFISWDGWRKGQPRGWESAAITVLHIPESERRTTNEQDCRLAKIEFNARRLFEQSLTRNLRLSDDGQSILLDRGQLYEDDGPAAGYSYRPNEEPLADGVLIKKELIIPRPHARKATLLVGRASGKNAGPIKVVINGRAADVSVPTKAGQYWEAYEFDPKLLRPGKNDVVLSGTGKIWIARDDEYAAGSRERTRHPNRSAKSTDGGRTWDYDRLGARGDIDGEYYVRVFLDQNHHEGSLTTPVIDLANPSGEAIAPFVKELGRVLVELSSDKGDGCRIGCRIRSGTTYVPGDKTWTPWQALQDGALDKPAGRFVQLWMELSTKDPLATPELKGLTLVVPPSGGQRARDAAAPLPPEGGTTNNRLKVVNAHNAAIVRSSIPFEYEPFDHPVLAQLRRQYKLDDVVAGAKDELQLIARLAAWSSQLWQRGHLGESYPAWNALDILKPHADGTSTGGFCQQYNLVFLQACESFGLVGRAVSIGQGMLPEALKGSGHEVVEIWSNQFGKWIYVDGNCGWYAVDRDMQEPLALWELRERQLAALGVHGSKQDASSRPIEIVKLAETRHDWPGLTSWPAFLELRLIPRSNFLAQTAPLPLNQGMRGWFWTGHYVWDDERVPATLLYGNRVRKRGDFEWTLNQAHYYLEATETPGRLRVHLDSVTPHFDTFMASIDGQPAKPVGPIVVPSSGGEPIAGSNGGPPPEGGTTNHSVFVWTLHTGRNKLEVWPRNTAGRDGVKSSIELDYSNAE